MAEEIALDRSWLAKNPLVPIPADTDKNERGRVLVVGGSRLSPGGLRLAGEAALRAGAGKVRLATLDCLAVPLGIAVPEAGIIALPEGPKGELAGDAVKRLSDDLSESDTVVIGPGMADPDAARPLLDAALDILDERQALVIDAAAIAAAATRLKELANARVRCVITPHAGEMGRLLSEPEETVKASPGRALRRAIEATGQIMVFKSAATRIAAPHADTLVYGGGGPGLATGGSGDVLAGIAGGLMSCGQEPFTAAAWSVWLHGEAGARMASQQGPIGYVARELLPLIPMLRATLG